MSYAKLVLTPGCIKAQNLRKITSELNSATLKTSLLIPWVAKI